MGLLKNEIKVQYPYCFIPCKVYMGSLWSADFSVMSDTIILFHGADA